MSDDGRIDVVVTDGVDPNVDKKLRAIATSADKGATSVARLKAELASINATPVAKLQAATETSTATINKQLAAQGALQKETDASAASDLKAVTSKTKLTAAIDAEAAARARLALAVDKGLANQAAANAPSAAFAAGGNPFQAGGGAAIGAEAAAVGASAKQMEAAVVEAESVSVSKLGNIKLAALGAYDTVRDTLAFWGGSFKGFFGSGGAATIEKEASSVGTLGKAAATNSVAIRELFVLGREASRGNFSRMAGSVSILAQSLGLLYTVLIPATAAIGLAVAGMKLFEVSIAPEANKQLQDYSTTLGLTSKEMRKLGDETVGAGGKLKSFNDIKLTFGDVFHGFVKAAEDTFDLQPQMKKLKTQVYDTAIEIANAFNEVFAEVYSTAATAADLVVTVWSKLPTTFKGFFVDIANEGMSIFEDMINDLIGGVNKLDAAIHAVVGGKAVVAQEIHFKRVGGDTGLGNVDLAAQGKADSDKYYNQFINGEKKFIQTWTKDSIDAGKQRLKGLADAITNNRNPKKERDPKTKADYLADENKKLDDQLSRMHLLKDAREEQQALDQIEEAFAKRKQTLTATEIAGFAAKIHAIQEYKYQQQEMDRIYDQFNGAQKIYSASLAASNDLLKRGAISAAQYALANAEAAKTLADAKGPADGLRGSYAALQVTLAQIKVWQDNLSISQTEATERTNLANRAYQEATDKLLPLKEQMTAATIAAGLYGTAAKQNAYYQQILNSEFGKANNLSPEYVAGTNAKVDALMKLNAALLQAQQLQSNVQSTVSGIVDPIAQDQTFLQNKQTYYDALNRMADQYNLKEQLRQQALGQLDLLYLKKRLAGASAFFTELSQLSQSKNKELAAIGKAAAVAQATIDGFVAVQAALKGPPGPPWSFAIAAATGVVAGANVARILSTNVGSFRDGGDFIVQGNAGVDNNNINFNASRGERVTVQTPAQQREADRKSGNGGQTIVPVKIINLQSKEEILNHMASDEGERVILNVLSDNPSMIRQLAGTKG